MNGRGSAQQRQFSYSAPIVVYFAFFLKNFWIFQKCVVYCKRIRFAYMNVFVCRIQNYLKYILMCLWVSACQSGDEMCHFKLSSFPVTDTLAGKAVHLPIGEPYVPGALETAGDGYLVYLYDADCFLVYVNDTWEEACRVAPKGEGPGEVLGVSGTFGQPLEKENWHSVYDPYACKLYGWDTVERGALHQVKAFPMDWGKYAPGNVIRLSSGKFVATRGDFQYGLVCCGAEEHHVQEWTSGEEVEKLKGVRSAYTSLRDLSYDVEHEVMAEIYGSCPFVILHDTAGTVIRTLAFDDYPLKTWREYEDPQECFTSVCLTSRYLWLLYGDTSQSGQGHVFVLQHDGTPVADLLIHPASTMAVDTRRGVIITVHPDREEHAIMAYPIPAFLCDSHTTSACR